MTDFVLQLKPKLKKVLWTHLLPKALREQAAFLFVIPSERRGKVVFNAVEADLLTATDFTVQYSDHFELSNEALVRTIKRAHHLGASIVEFHSHRDLGLAVFSLSDRLGLLRTVPHMRWRLKRRPYIAVVVAQNSFDALVWTHEKGMIPDRLSGIASGATLISPTNLSLEDWNGGEPTTL